MVDESSNPESLSREQLIEAVAELRRRLENGDRAVPADAGLDLHRELFERSADAILIIDGETFVDCNQATVDMLRYRTKEELLQTHPSVLSPEFQPDGRPSFEKANEMIALAFEKGSHRFEWDHKRADDSVFPVEVLLTAMEIRGRPGLHVVWRDITERKRLEAELRQAQKMEALGKLTGGIAHDFNNLLVAILGYAELLDQELPDENEYRGFVEEIRQAGERAAALVGQLLAFSRKQVLHPQVIELNKVIRGLEKMLLPLLGEDIEFRLELHEEPLYIKADPGQLEQVVVNLATNARDAIPRKGTLVLRTGFAALDMQGIGKELSLEPGLHVVLSVTDTGCGIAATDKPRIFDPFFTTKGVNEGTGLGLSTVHGIVKQSGGDIRVRSTVGEGTEFEVYLPATDERPEPAVRPLEDIDSDGTEPETTILMVEDEEAVSGLIEAILRREGYRVVVARNGREALEMVGDLPTQPNLLLTDVIMPEMGGPELARHLAERWPDLKVVYASGYTDSALIHRGALEEGVELIEKPFVPRQLIERLRHVLNGD